MRLVFVVGCLSLALRCCETFSPIQLPSFQLRTQLCRASRPMEPLNFARVKSHRSKGILSAPCMSTIKLPQSVAEMMRDAGGAVNEGLRTGLTLMSVEVPLPITGGTELDDWPGGIGQKYRTLKPMAGEMMRTMNFTKDEIDRQEFIGLTDDAIGLWRSQSATVVCFATPERLDELEAIRAAGTPLVLLNHQFFLDEFSKERTKQFIASSTIVYQLQSLNMKGPGLLPIKGVLSRTFPDPFLLGRRLEGGGVAVIGSFADKPARSAMDEIFLRDSEERDKGLSLWDRLKRIQQEASKI